MKIFYTLILSMCLFIRPIYSQTYDLNFIEVLNDGANYDVKVQIRASSVISLAASNITFNFNSAGLINPTLLAAHNFNGPNAGPPMTIYGSMTVTNPLTGVASINIVFTQGDAAYAGIVGTEWVNVATVRFTVTNSSASSALSFRSATPSPTVVYSCSGSSGSFHTNLLAAGTWNTLNDPMPVELTSFAASANENCEVRLKWTTATEVNNYGYEVERKSKEWETLGFVKGNGNSNNQREYSFIDKSPAVGLELQYRLKQIDNNGKWKYYDIVKVNVEAPKEFKLMQNSPNPFNPVTAIKFQLPKETHVSVVIYNMLGREVATLLNEDRPAGSHIVYWNGKDSRGMQTASGVYLYRLQAGSFVETRKMNLMK